MRRKILLLVPAVVIPAIVLAYAGTNFAEEYRIEKAIHNAYDEGVTVIRYSDSGEVGKTLALKRAGWGECCSEPESCGPQIQPVAMTDADLADVPRIKTMLEVAQGEEFSDINTYRIHSDLIIYEIYGGDDFISVDSGMPGHEVRQHDIWMHDLRTPVIEYEGEFFVLGVRDDGASWSSLMGNRGC